MRVYDDAMLVGCDIGIGGGVCECGLWVKCGVVNMIEGRSYVCCFVAVAVLLRGGL